MIKPTVGRVVWYRPYGIASGIDQPYPALICHVHSDRMVNLAYFDPNGKPGNIASVTLVQEGDPRPPSGFCEWMPFQVGQAKLLASAEPVRETVALGDGTILRLIAEYGPKIVKWLIAAGILKVPPGFLTVAEEVPDGVP